MRVHSTNSKLKNSFFFPFRLIPPGTVIPRIIDQEIEVCGYQIPAKVGILLCMHCIPLVSITYNI